MGTKIQLLTTAASAEWRGQPGDVVEISDEEAQQLLGGGYAILPGSEDEASESAEDQTDSGEPGEDLEPVKAAAKPKAAAARKGASKSPAGE